MQRTSTSFRLSLGLVMLLFPPLLARAAEPEFGKVESEAGRFIVEMPGAPQVKTMKTSSGFVYYQASSRSGDLAFYIFALDLPAVEKNLKFPQGAMTAFRNGAYSGIKISSDQEITLAGTKVPGREFLAELEKGHVRERMYLDGHRLYRLSVSGAKDAVGSKTADQFLDSFRLRPAGEKEKSAGVGARKDTAPVLAAEEDQASRVASDEEPKLLAELKSDKPYPNAEGVAFTPDGRRLLVAGGGLEVWDVESGEKQTMLLTGTVNHLAIHPGGGKAVAANNVWGKLRWVELVVGRSFGEWIPPEDTGISGIAFSPDGAVLAVDQRNAVTLWNVAAGTPGRAIRYAPESASIDGLAFSSDGKTLVTGAAGEVLLQLWNVADGSLKQSIESDAGYLKSACYTPDGKLLVTGHGDAAVRVWEAASGELKATFKSSEKRVSLPRFSVAVSPDGRLAAAAGVDQTARVWDLQTGRLVATLPGRSDRARITSVAFAPDARRLAVGFSGLSADGHAMAMIWELPSSARKP